MTCCISYLLYYSYGSMEFTHAPVCLSDCTYVNMYDDIMVSKCVSTLTFLVTPDPLPPPPSTSAPMTTPDPQALIFQHPRQKLNRI